ncbi:hypothetical protein AAVH_08334 [Aphelenchoides avenae]|nr:hypothetical protein AAVH_08334 [Aphelenchus avenae]
MPHVLYKPFTIIVHSLVIFKSQFSSSRRCVMLPCRRRATRASSASTSYRLVAASIVSVVLVSSCSWCAAQQVIDIAPEDVSQYYPDVSLSDDKYTLKPTEEPVTFLLRTVPESEFEAKLWSTECGKELVLTNGWNTSCGLRFECKKESNDTLQAWVVFEKAGSEPFLVPLVMMPVFEGGKQPSLTKQADESNLQASVGMHPYPLNDCVLETRSLGDHLIFNLTFTSVPRSSFSVDWNATTTVFVRLAESTTTSEPTTTTEEPTTTTEATETNAPTSSSPETTTTRTATTTKPTPKLTSVPVENPHGPPSHSASPNANDTTPSEHSAAGGLQLDHFVAAVVVVQ